MKRLIAALLCCLLIMSACLAESMDMGKMEIVNCREWVSLRETPDTGARRLVKVSLGSIVQNCRKFNDQWIYAEFDGYSGYILAEYLQPCDDSLIHAAMMITNTEDGAPFYAIIDGEDIIDIIPANTIVRNCHIMENNRIYVELGDRCGFIKLLHAEVYNEMLHFPRQITLHCNLFDGEYEGPAPALKIAALNDFPLQAYDYNDFEYADYMDADEDNAKVKFVLYSDDTLSQVHLFSVSINSLDADTGYAEFEAILEETQYQMDPEHPLVVGAVIWGDTPNLAVGYADALGVYHFTFIEISGEDGSLILREF